MVLEMLILITTLKVLKTKKSIIINLCKLDSRLL